MNNFFMQLLFFILANIAICDKLIERGVDANALFDAYYTFSISSGLVLFVLYLFCTAFMKTKWGKRIR